MNKILLALKSRTVWTVVLMFLVGGVNAIHGSIPQGTAETIQAFLGFAAVFFHLNPSQRYN